MIQIEILQGEILAHRRSAKNLPGKETMLTSAIHERSRECPMLHVRDSRETRRADREGRRWEKLCASDSNTIGQATCQERLSLTLDSLNSLEEPFQSMRLTRLLHKRLHRQLFYTLFSYLERWTGI